MTDKNENKITELFFSKDMDYSGSQKERTIVVNTAKMNSGDPATQGVIDLELQAPDGSGIYDQIVFREVTIETGESHSYSILERTLSEAFQKGGIGTYLLTFTWTPSEETANASKTSISLPIHYGKADLPKRQIIYHTGNGYNDPANPQAITQASGIITLKDALVPEPWRSAKAMTFTGWYLDADCTQKVTKLNLLNSNISALKTEHIHLYAGWKYKEYAIQYEADGGTGNALNPTTRTVNTAPIMLCDPEKKGYRFTGWYADAEKTKPVTVIPQGMTKDLTLYAGWELIHYNIYYNAFSGKLPEGNPSTYTVYDAFSLKEPIFSGNDGKWFTDHAFTDELAKVSAGTTGNLVLYGDGTIEGNDNDKDKDNDNKNDKKDNNKDGKGSNSDSNTEKGSDTSSAAKTGDPDSLLLWVIIALTSIGLLIGLGMRRRYARENNQSR